MNIILNFFKDNKKESKISLSKNNITIGRDANCDVVINDSMVSGHHFSIISKDNKVFLVDNSSLNGTFLDGKPSLGQTAMGKKGEISFCSHKIEFEIESDITVEHSPAEKEDALNKTMISMQIPNFEKKVDPISLLKSRKVIIGIGVFFVLSLIILLLIPTGNNKKQTKNPFKARMIDSYFIQLDKRISETITDKKSIENAQNFYKVAKDKKKQINLNREAQYEVLLLIIKAKESMSEINPKPELWDTVNPELIKTKNKLKGTIQQLYTDAWVAERRGDDKKAKEIYGFVLDSVPDPESSIYKNTEIRINRLQ